MGLGVLKRYLFSLRTVLVFAVIAGVSLSSLLAYLDFASRARVEHIANLELELGRLASLTALAMREPIWEITPDQAESILDSVFINPDILSMVVNDDKEQIFVRRINASLASQLEPDRIISANRAIERNGVVIGHLAVAMSTAGYLAKLDAERDKYIRTAAILLVGSLSIILIALQWGLVRPVRRLVASSALIAQGQLNAPVPRTYSTELDVLAGVLDSTRLALIALFSDVETRNQLLADANENLEQRVAERTHSLEKALDSLQRAQDEIFQKEKLASLGSLVAGVAHELNTPIGNAVTIATTVHDAHTRIRNLLDTGMTRNALVDFIDTVGDGAMILERNLHRAAELVTNFKQLAVDQSSCQRREFNLHETVEDVRVVMAPALRKAKVTFESAIPAEINLDSYPGPFTQALMILVNNSLVHAFSGKETGCIQIVATNEESGWITVTVSDDGVGIPKMNFSHIFEPFFTTKLGQGGSGLGLHIFFNIVTGVLSGRVSVDSKIDQGTRFTISIPKSPPTAQLNPFEV